MTDEYPELAGYEPSGEKPLRSPHVLLGMRILVCLGIVSLVLPGIVTTMSVGSATARSACERWVTYQRPDASGFDVRFEFFGPGGVGWQCYSVGAFGPDSLVASLGLIPTGARMPVRAG